MASYPLSFWNRTLFIIGNACDGDHAGLMKQNRHVMRPMFSLVYSGISGLFSHLTSVSAFQKTKDSVLFIGRNCSVFA